MSAGVPPPDAPGGLSDRLRGARVPAIPLPSTGGRVVDLSALPGWAVVFVHPQIGPAEGGMPAGWDDVPGLRGCTAQSCCFRDYWPDFGTVGAAVFGLSTQDGAGQREAVARLGLPYELLSDEHLAFVRALGLLEVEVGGRSYAARLTLVLSGGRVTHVFHPVTEPAQNAEAVIAWLRTSRPACPYDGQPVDAVRIGPYISPTFDFPETHASELPPRADPTRAPRGSPPREQDRRMT